MTVEIIDPQIEKLKLAISLLDGQQNLATALNLKTQGQISAWVRKRRPIPAIHCKKIESVTNNKVTRYDLRPDIFGAEPDISTQSH